MLKQLLAPWRISFILKKKEKGCVFCKIAKNPLNDRKNYVLKRNKNTFVVLNLYPYNNGHIMIVPYKHASLLSSLNFETLSELMVETDYWVKRIQEVMKPDGFNIGMNLGKAAGAGIADHLHLHIVPRWIGDANFMPVVGEIKVIPESLDSVYQRLIK